MVNHTQGLAGTIAKTGIWQDGQASEGRRMKTLLEEAAAGVSITPDNAATLKTPEPRPAAHY